jgi:two-component system response regulator FixJ
MYRHLGDNSGTFHDIIGLGGSTRGIAESAATPVVCVLGCDDRTRNLIIVLLEKEKFSVQSYETIAEFRARSETQPDCLLVDLAGLGATMADILRVLEKRNGRTTPVIVIGPASVGAAVQYMKAGASDCLPKPLNETALIECVRRMSAIGQANRRKAEHIAAAKAKLESLTERERQVLDLMISGRTNQAVGEELNISGRTAEHYRERIKAKFEAKHLVEILYTAIVAMQSVSHESGNQREPVVKSNKARFRRHYRGIRTAACTHFPEQAA